MWPLRKREGFTLVELIIVVFAIGIFAAVLMPRYFALHKKALRASFDATVSNIRSGAEAYHYACLAGKFDEYDPSNVIYCPTNPLISYDPYYVHNIESGNPFYQPNPWPSVLDYGQAGDEATREYPFFWVILEKPVINGWTKGSDMLADTIWYYGPRKVDSFAYIRATGKIFVP